MEQRLLLLFLSALLLSSCSLYRNVKIFEEQYDTNNDQSASVIGIFSDELLNVQAPKQKPVIAVYPNSFTDQTGQRKSNSSYALFSTAVTQAPQALLIRALKHTAGGKFFIVVERVGLDNLTKERQLIRSSRNEDEKKLKPLLFAGIIMEGAVISYDTNLRTGGMGARYLGLGSSIEYREDIVSVSLRLVSVLTGEILVEVLAEKTIFSYGQTQDAFKFIEQGTELVEVEVGNAVNESPTIALQKAIEGAILEIVKIGYERRFWSYE